MLPSSPQLPCRALNTTSGFSFLMVSIKSYEDTKSCSTTSYPQFLRAELTPAPLTKLTSLSAEKPPFNTNTFFICIILPFIVNNFYQV